MGRRDTLSAAAVRSTRARHHGADSAGGKNDTDGTDDIDDTHEQPAGRQRDPALHTRDTRDTRTTSDSRGEA
jgi:hypothetical protein